MKSRKKQEGFLMRKWEDICNKCGLCCHRKVVAEDFLLLDLAETCEFLDKETNLCNVYKDRFKKCKDCKKVTPFMAAFSPALPATCAYVKLFEKYHLRFCKMENVFSEHIFD